MEDLELLKVEYDVDDSVSTYAAYFAKGGKTIRVIMQSDDNMVWQGHSKDLYPERFGLYVTFIEVCGAGSQGYNRLLTVQDDCADFGAIWQICDCYYSGGQTIKKINLM